MSNPNRASSVLYDDESELSQPIAERSIDYIGVTIKTHGALEALKAFFPAEFEERKFGSRLYRRSAVSAGGCLTLCWEGSSEGMGAHLYASGEGCRYIESLPGFNSWQDLFGRLLVAGASFTRCDLALDDRSGRVNFDTVERQIVDRRCITRSEPGNTVIGRGRGRETSRTVYLGSRQSMSYLRCYEKGKQLGQDPNWLRFEFEFKAEKAQAFVATLAAEGWDKAVGIVRSVVDFVHDRSRAKRRHRQKVAGWWLELVAASKHRVSVTKTVLATLERAETFITRQVAVVLGCLVESKGGDVSWISDLVNASVVRRSSRHRLLLMPT